MSGGYAIRADTPWITTKRLSRRTQPPSQEYIDRVRFMNSHDFSVFKDEATGEYICRATPKADADI